MNLIVIGVNHQTAPVEVREQFAISEARLPEAAEAIGIAAGRRRRHDRLHLQPSGAHCARDEWQAISGLCAEVLRLRGR